MKISDVRKEHGGGLISTLDSAGSSALLGSSTIVNEILIVVDLL